MKKWDIVFPSHTPSHTQSHSYSMTADSIHSFNDVVEVVQAFLRTGLLDWDREHFIPVMRSVSL